MSSIRFDKQAILLLASAGVLAIGGCVSIGADTYEDFQGAVEAGAPCSELFDIREGFEDSGDLERIDADLAEIGCESRNSERTDD